MTEKDFIGAPIFWGPDENGIQTLTYIVRDGKAFGLTQDDHGSIDPLVDAVLSIPWARERLSRKFVEGEFLTWSRLRFTEAVTENFADALLAAASEKIRPMEVWLPIAHLEIEDSITFGPVKIAPITDSMLEKFESKAISLCAEQADDLSALFQQIREDIQGLAAIVLPMEAEPIFAKEVALLVARDAVNLLRFFSPGARFISMLCPTALAGTELIPGSKVLFVGDGSLLSMVEETEITNVAPWRIRMRTLPQLNKMGFPLAGMLIAPEGLGDFERWVRASLITYSKGATFPDPVDRLEHALEAIEGVLLRHTMEPIEFNVADRMSFIISPDGSEREAITQNVRQAYRLRTRHRAAPLAPNEMEALTIFVINAHCVLVNALASVKVFGTRADFVAAVDGLGSNPIASKPKGQAPE